MIRVQTNKSFTIKTVNTSSENQPFVLAFFNILKSSHLPWTSLIFRRPHIVLQNQQSVQKIRVMKGE